MTELILLVKLYGSQNSKCLEVLQKKLNAIALDLEVTIQILGQTDKGWVKIQINGSDEVVAVNYLHKRFGIAIESIEALRLPMVTKGYVVDAGKVGYGLYVDIAVSTPKDIDAFIPLHVLRKQLADGARLSTRKIIEAYCLFNNFPLSIRLTNVNILEKKVEAELSDIQISFFQRWIEDELDRVLIFGIPFKDVKGIIEKTKLRRDVIKIESFGLFEQSLVCKLGTAAPGIIRKIGTNFQSIPLGAFLPTKIKNEQKYF